MSRRATIIATGLGLVMTAAACAAVFSYGSLDVLPSRVAAGLFGLWLAVLVIRLALTVGGPTTPGEKLLGTVTLWPGAILAAIGIGFLIAKYAPSQWGSYLAIQIVVFAASCLAAVVVVKLGDR